MTIARLVLQIRRRAKSLSNDTSAAALERAAREVLWNTPPGDEADIFARTTLAALLGLHEGQRFDAAMLQGLTPELVLRLDAMLHALARQARSVRTMRAAIIRPGTD